MTAYYNEFDPFAAAWLRELIKAGHIAPGIVDERSIEDVLPKDLDGFTQCHFFSGIGVWSYALRQAGWSDDRPVWTGSCPCQSFSTAGKGAGFDDPRHLWPHFFRLIKECRPNTVFGEQVEAAIRHGWLDLVQADLEREDYSFGAVVFPASGIGAPHIRSRLYWVADTASEQHDRSGDTGERWRDEYPDGCTVCLLSDSMPTGRTARGAESRCGQVAGGCEFGGLADAGSGQFQEQVGRQEERNGTTAACAEHHRPCPTNGFWRDADWLFCRDGKWRPTQSEIFPLVNWATNRVGLLRGAGNAIVAPQAKAFIEAFLSIRT
jgi:DNA (cytosine-5)-methyltransferase 1